ncbi:MAG: pantoate--beta-alanine ligase, partial [Flavobacteriales bacterium]|nr:pantoate--beta-alanine ligase [Flavobacteriales bacterium]
MEVIHSVSALRKKLDVHRFNGKSIGFVPTMGALHEGHLDLVRQSVAENNITICSIFVNPTQFDNSDDLDQYPRIVDSDVEILTEVNCDFAFVPNNAEVYPTQQDKKAVDYGNLTHALEGEYRSGHFDGVVQVVRRLFEIVEPTRAYFGEKDYQQLAVIRHLVTSEGLPVEIVPVSTRRHESGLAQSSRNLRLSEDGRETAAHIFQVLSSMIVSKDQMSPDTLC